MMVENKLYILYIYMYFYIFSLVKKWEFSIQYVCHGALYLEKPFTNIIK